MNDKPTFSEPEFAPVMQALDNVQLPPEWRDATPTVAHLNVYIKLLMSATKEVLNMDQTDTEMRKARDRCRRLVFKLEGVIK